MIKLKGLVDEDIVNYHKTSMYLIFPFCSFKCDHECGQKVCQNSSLAEHPIVEIYKGYEIRTNGIDKFGFTSYLCDAAIAIYGITSTTIEGCREFIDTLVEQGIKQYDDEAVSKYIFANHKY